MEKAEQLAKIIEKKDEILTIYPSNEYVFDRPIEELIELISELEKMSLTEDGKSTHESASYTDANLIVRQIKAKELSTVKWWSRKTQGTKKEIEGLEMSLEIFHRVLSNSIRFIIPM